MLTLQACDDLLLFGVVFYVEDGAKVGVFSGGVGGRTDPQVAVFETKRESDFGFVHDRNAWTERTDRTDD